MERLYYDLNIPYFAKISNFELKKLTKENCHEYMSSKSKNGILELKAKLQNRISDMNRVEDIVYQVSLYLVLLDNGGVLLTDFYAITESFHWIKDLKNDIHAYRGIDHSSPEVFAFYTPERCSPNKKENIKAKY